MVNVQLPLIAKGEKDAKEKLENREIKISKTKFVEA